jgi:hypothetical protein
MELGTLLPPAGQITPLGQELVRYRTAAVLMERAGELVSENSPQEMADWFAPWGGRLASSRRALDVLRLENSEEWTLAATQVETIDKEQAALAARLSAVPSDHVPGKKLAGGQRLFELVEEGYPAVHLSFAGAQTKLELNYGPGPASDWPARWPTALGLLACALAVYVLAVRGHLAEWLTRWPQVCGVAAGLGWWLFLSPSLLGWAIIALSLWSAVRFPWKVARVRMDPLSSLSGAARRAAG